VKYFNSPAELFNGTPIYLSLKYFHGITPLELTMALRSSTLAQETVATVWSAQPKI